MNAVQINSMPALIAWFSICLLAAATGRLLDDRWQIIWAELGAFGLVAAVGLGSLEKVRAARDLRARDRNLQTRLESGLDRLNDHSATLDSINVAVRRLTEHVAKRRRARTSTVTHAAERSWETELLAYYPVEILPLEEEDSTHPSRTAKPIVGRLRQISSAVVSFEHLESFNTRLVLLTFKLNDDERLSFVVDVMWTQKFGEEFASSGTVWAVGVPAAEGDSPAQGEPVADALADSFIASEPVAAVT